MAGQGIKITVGAEYNGSDLDKAIKQLEQLKRESMTAGQKFAAFGKGMQTVGKNLSMYVSLPLIAAGAAAVAFSTQFGKSMANVSTLIPGNTERVEELKASLMELGPEVGKSLGDLSDGLYQVISAFGDTADTVQILETNAKAAAAGLATTREAIDLTSAVTKAYGDTSAAAVTNVSDLSLLAVRLGQTTFPELAGSIGRVTALTSELGVSQEELFAVMATFTGVTGGAAEVSTQLRGVMQSLLSPTAQMAGALREAGIESGAALIEQEGLAGAIEFMVAAADSSGEGLNKFIGSIEGQTLALALSGAQAEDYSTKLGEMQNAAGTTDEAFGEMTSGVGEAAFTFEQLAAKAEVMLVSLGDGIAPALMGVLDAVSPLIDGIVSLAQGFSDLDPAAQAFIVFMGGAVALAGPVILAVGQMITAFRTMQTALMGAVGATNALKFTLISSGIGAAIVVISSAIAALAFSNSQASADIEAFNASVRDQNGVLKENSAQQAFARLQSLGYMDIAKELGLNTYDLAEAYLEGGDALQVYIDAIQKYIDTGPGLSNTIAATDFIEELQNQKSELEGNEAAMAEYAQAHAEAAREVTEHRAHMDKGTEGLDANAEAAKEAAARQQELADSLQRTTDEFAALSGFLDERAKLRAYEQAVDDFAATVAETGVNLDTGTEAGRDFEASLDGIFNAALAVAEGQDTAKEKVGALRQGLRDARAELAGMPMTAAEKQALLQPFIDAIAKAKETDTEIQSIKDKTVTITIYTQHKSDGREDAYGGYPAATGGLVSGPGGPRDDMIPMRLSNGEYVIQAAAVKKFGVQFMSMLNQGRLPGNMDTFQDVPGPSRSMGPARSGGGLTINGGITVNQVGRERADQSLPRALRRMAWVAGLDG